jgi:hypothetical protein
MGEADDSMDFTTAKARRLAALDRLLAITPALETAGAPSLTDDDIQAEVDAARYRRTRARVE